MALANLPVEEAIIDGEVVAENAAGAPDFSALQDALATGHTERLAYYAFDLLYSEYFEEDGSRLLRHACRLGLEGIVSKLRDAPYRSGRGKDWTKSKCSDRQEFVVAGYVLSSRSGMAIGSLVLGYFDAGKLIHACRVGTGFTNKVAAELFRRLDDTSIPKSPFARKLSALDARGVRFVRPKLVAEVEFRAWTAEGLIRHASFRGLREDKAAHEVKLER